MSERREDIGVVDKREVDTMVHQELRSGNWFVPAADIYETPEQIVLVRICLVCALIALT